MLCAREGCPNEVPPGRRKHCSDACSRRVAHDKEAAQKRAVRAQERTATSGRPSLAGVRICLKCDRTFKSTDPGNRICGRCAERNAEIDAAPVYHVALPADYQLDRRRRAGDRARFLADALRRTIVDAAGGPGVD